MYYCDVSRIEIENKMIDSLPSIRKVYVESITDLTRKKQSILVWKLLEYALNDSFKLVNSEFYLESDGKWNIRNKDVYFSLTHSADIVAVAVGTCQLGIDVEKISEKLLKLQTIFKSSDVEFLALEWTKKESLFKFKNGNNFSNKKISGLNGEKYYLTVCSTENAEFLEVSEFLLNE